MKFDEFRARVVNLIKSTPATPEQIGKSADDDLDFLEWLNLANPLPEEPARDTGPARLAYPGPKDCEVAAWGGGQSRCNTCGLVWDTNDPEPPQCPQI